MNRKTTFPFLFLLMFFSLQGIAQTRIVVQSGDETQVFGHFPAALAAAQDGDIIYLPGGAIDIGIAYIEKSLTIYGAGHYPQYTQATGVTMLNGTLYLRQADAEVPLENIHLEGFYLSGDFRIGTTTTNQNVNQVTVRRCNINNVYLSRYGYDEGNAEQIHFIENVIRGSVQGGNAQNVMFTKNIIQGFFYYFNGNALFSNNIFMHNTTSSVSTSFRYIYNTVFTNNIMLCSQYTCFNNMSANRFDNNMWRFPFSVPTGSTGDDNIPDQNTDEIFINHTGHSFNYDYNYQLSEGSPGIGTGTDEFDIGIYGTIRPYKEGAVPRIPRIVTQSIATETNAEGKLQVEVEVEAQGE